MTGQRKNIVFITSNHLEHPRTKMYLEVLSAHHSVSAIQHVEKSIALKIINFIFFGKNFELGCLAYLGKIRKYDLLIVQNTQMLPLALFGKFFGLVVIFDSLDVTPYLNEYNLRKKYRFLSPLFFIHRLLFVSLEKKIVSSSCEVALCNSKFLANYFKKRGRELLYASFLEGLNNQSENESALLYLGVFNSEKGAYEALKLARRLRARIFIFGEIQIKDFKEKSSGLSIYIAPRLNQDQLKLRVEEILNRHFLWGVSLIESENFSYAVQEANKDIDYLAIGAPIIGNRRHETQIKIQSGAGLLVDDERIEHAFNNSVLKSDYSRLAKKLYQRDYQSSIFEERVLSAVSYEN